MKNEALLQQVMERHRAFWEMEEVDRPLLQVGRYQPLQHRQPFLLADGSPVQEGTVLRPEMVDVCHLMPHCEPPDTAVNGDFIRGFAPYDLCWTEAIAGCPLRWRTAQVWSDPFLENLDGIEERLKVTPDNLWLGKLVEITRFLVAQAQGHCSVCQPLLRGPIDMASAVLGDEQLCWAMVDEPERFRRLLEVCTTAFITVARTWQAASPPFQGGYCEYGIWAPGTAIRTQADNAALLSPPLYHDFLLPCDARICAAFDYPLIHTHSGVLHIMVEALLTLKPLRAIQVSLDYPAGPPLAELLPLLKQANQHKPLIITGGVTRQELSLLLQELSPRGLCLQVGLHSEGAEG